VPETIQPTIDSLATFGHFWSILVIFGHVGQFWVNFGSILGQLFFVTFGHFWLFWVNFGSILGQFWVNFGSFLGQLFSSLLVDFGHFWSFTVIFGSILGQLWVDCFRHFWSHNDGLCMRGWVAFEYRSWRQRIRRLAAGWRRAGV
jgi:hypothetical protein